MTELLCSPHFGRVGEKELWILAPQGPEEDPTPREAGSVSVHGILGATAHASTVPRLLVEGKVPPIPL